MERKRECEKEKIDLKKMPGKQKEIKCKDWIKKIENEEQKEKCYIQINALLRWMLFKLSSMDHFMFIHICSLYGTVCIQRPTENNEKRGNNSSTMEKKYRNCLKLKSLKKT